MSSAASNLNPTRHVYFSRTEDNPYLPKWYIEGLKQDLDPKLARRMLYGEWIEIASDVVYHAYTEARNYRAETYEVRPGRRIFWAWDFNIGEGKPLSTCFTQVDSNGAAIQAIHVFQEVIIAGASTEDACDEAAARGLLDHDCDYVIHGDATGASRSTKSKASDYDIIEKFLANHRQKSGAKIDFTIDVPRSNPPIRTRHNLVNAFCQNEAGRSRLFVYRDAPTVNKGMKLTALKKGGKYIEDDSKDFQHVTTALGYHVHRVHSTQRVAPSIQGRQIR